MSKLYHYVYARIRDEIFYTLKALNARIFQLMEEFNEKPMQKKGLAAIKYILKKNTL